MTNLKHLSVCLFVLLFVLSVPVVHAQISGSSVPGEIIVKYKSGQSPRELAREIQVRDDVLRKPIVGQLALFIEAIQRGFHGDEPPSEKLAQITTAEQAIGVYEKQHLFVDDGTSEEIYLLKYNAPLKPEDIVELYKLLPVVEYVEPNFLTETSGI